MTIEEAIERLQQVSTGFEKIVLDLLLAEGFSANALINKRVELSGIDADGGFFSDYSEGYAKKRAKEGRQTSYKDFSFTRELWKSIGVTLQATQQGKVVVVYEPKDQTNKDKLRYLEQQEGKSILELSKEEEDKIAQVIDLRLTNLLNKL